MSIFGRVADLFQAKTHKLLSALEDPNETLDLSYEKMITGLQDTKRPECVPATLLSWLLHLDEQRSGNALLQRPPPVRFALLTQQIDRIGEPLVRDRGCQA